MSKGSLPPLSKSAMEAMAEVARQLANGFTGEIKLECNDGGVRKVRGNNTLWPPRKPKKP